MPRGAQAALTEMGMPCGFAERVITWTSHVEALTLDLFRTHNLHLMRSGSGSVLILWSTPLYKSITQPGELTCEESLDGSSTHG